ncbi:MULTISPECIES: SDR family NAD(P)-dependent oxidoreductase [unclassified Variovorax]|uniref:SDR family NAD(P)-dependent oxidoreductase n=1 Tax=unclassified Variovorax TaxID=663243 RepID=UPI0013180412|nr:MULTISPECIES: SDR family NAD(P)-dependent oxidoreductase [unclassified Variovorax]VTU13525.1 Benzil reductase ((S)-benzoin forming) [Variovorax sp. SRS16]VTU18475.1 Benzil reductase ((S)-benzoin forming) [Variovorax sp. PBL-E5]
MTSSHLAIITGASRGLGRAMAEQLLQPGRFVLCISRQSDDSLAAQAREAGATLEQWRQDLADPVAAAARLAAWLQGLDAQAFDSATLINNAGTVGRTRPLSEAVAAELAQALRIGLEAPMLLTSAFLGATKAWRAQRKVLNISSGLGRHAMGSQAPYCAAKAGMDHFSRAVALEEKAAPNGAAIVSLAPGVIDTDMQVQLRESEADMFPDRVRFERMKAEGLLDSPATAAEKVLKYLARKDFGSNPVADVRDPA